jgi:hypothetical protein
MSDNRSFKHWNKYDPVANAIKALVVAQDFLSDHQASATVDAKLDARTDAIRELVMAQMTYWRENAERPPAVREEAPGEAAEAMEGMIYLDEEGNYTDADGNPVDEYGDPIPSRNRRQRSGVTVLGRYLSHHVRLHRCGRQSR